MAKEEGLTVKKNENFSEWFSQVIQKADLVDIRFGIQGFIVHKPWAFLIIRKLYDYLEKEVEKQGHLPYLFPRVVKEAALMQEKEHANFTPEVFWVSEAGDKKIEERFALPPTGEAQIYPLYSLWFRSYRDLPFKGYQSRITVYRNEMTTRPFLRGREFLFFETHNVFNKHEEVLQQIEEDLDTCEKVIKRKVKIPFLYFKRPVWDKFMGADATFTADTLMPDGKRNQLASTHDFGQRFAKAYNISVIDERGNNNFAWQTAFGPGIWRIMAALIGVHGDDKGLVLPFDMAPVQIVIIPITFAKRPEASQKVLDKCKELESELKMEGYRVTFDANQEETPGNKFNKWELKGVPIRLEIGPRDLEDDQVVLKSRVEEQKFEIKIKELLPFIIRKAKELDTIMGERAEQYLQNKVRDATTVEEIIQIMQTHRGFIRVPFCSVEADGEACEKMLKEKTEGGRVCGTFYPEPEKVKANDTCAVCAKKAEHIVYIAKSY